MEYNIKITRKNVKNYNLRVTTGLEVKLSVPIKSTKKDIDNFIIRKKPWITSKLNNFKNSSLNYKEPNYDDGDLFLYIGKKIKLKLEKSIKEYVYINENNLVIGANDIYNKANKRAIVDKMLKKHALKLFHERIQIILNKFNEKQAVNITVRKMSTRWGSCNSKLRKINLNIQLIHYNIDFIDSVIAHEVAHLKHANHSKTFYKHLISHMPNYNAYIKNKIII